jgi:hypothetical protein
MAARRTRAADDEAAHAWIAELAPNRFKDFWR